MAANTPEVSLMIFQSMLPQASQSHDKSVFVDLLGLIVHHHLLLEHSQKALFYLEQAKPFLDAVPESTRQDFYRLSLQWKRQFAEH
ncbi:hypothetical protein KDD30_07595 [Photobacterium sp. GJ3]|uniref:hypothetical protein n=1 Tax=Photobacterium sp. GJ3 TaxID=2829502 RepID=UPI001B8B62D6|nr:hypothetical protein [Photobacterium sp. GJ3]QUJ68926.1 hypothetical protein KDD30_07595 [Photobacterium sp. GJ3]